MFCGIDLGSRQVKIVLSKESKELEFYSFDTIDFYKNHGRKMGDTLLVDFGSLGLPQMDLSPLGADKLVTTGYGRNTLKLEGGQEIPEIKAHAIGACWQTGLKDFTLLDLGGQDSKVVLVRQGKVRDFQTNDKCAAGSGRYLENMSGILGMSVNELGNYIDDPVDLDATCAIFGESEIIGRIIEGHSLEHLAAGVNYTVFKRIRPMLMQLESPTVIFTGGVAMNGALQNIIEKELGVKIIVPPYPQHNGAIGCCVHGGMEVR